MTDATDAAKGAHGGGEDPLLGRVIGGRYRLVARMGHGNMGALYRAYDTTLHRGVAIKVLHARLTADESVAQRFDREALAVSRLDHGNCVQVLDAGTTADGEKFIVMQLLEGRELRDLITQGPMAPARAVGLAVQILRGLDHAHRRGLVHRDLKPENVLVVLDDDGHEVVKLVDFGIVKLLTGDEQKLTRAGIVFGTPRYMSPEQVSGGKIDERADLYAVGVVLFEMLTGAPPFEADQAGMLMRMHVLADVPPLPETVPPSVRAVVARLLEKSPNDRFASAHAVIDALESAPRVPAPMLAAAVPSPVPTRPPAAVVGAAAPRVVVHSPPLVFEDPPRLLQRNRPSNLAAFIAAAIVVAVLVAIVLAMSSSAHLP
jgi:serine/threonine protein kinase